jgi:predicted transposase YbfD/YdcC
VKEREREQEQALARALLADLEVQDRVVTGDAQFCQRDLSRQVVAAGGDYFWAVKDNQPELREAIATLFALPPPGERFGRVVSRTRHGDRREVRTLLASTALNDYLDWPHVGQVCVTVRAIAHKGQTRREVAYAITSLPPARATARRLLALWRGHWGIENRLHWVRDVTFDEDRCQVRTGAAPQVMAALRNTAIGALRRAGHTNIAAALRTYAARPRAALALLGLATSERL